MTGARLAEWIIFHRLFVTRFNEFIDLCPLGFKYVLDELDILSCEKVYRRKRVLAFEATTELRRPGTLTMDDAGILIRYRPNVVAFLHKVASLYPGCATRPLSEYEAWLLSGWLKVDFGRYLAVKYDKGAL